MLFTEEGWSVQGSAAWLVSISVSLKLKTYICISPKNKHLFYRTIQSNSYWKQKIYSYSLIILKQESSTSMKPMGYINVLNSICFFPASARVPPGIRLSPHYTLMSFPLFHIKNACSTQYCKAIIFQWKKKKKRKACSTKGWIEFFETAFILISLYLGIESHYCSYKNVFLSSKT